MTFKSKSDDSLLTDLKALIAREREILTEILHALREVEARKLHLERGYPSLFEFATRELGYSNAAAQRRILAMRLLRTVPEMEPKIASGELSLSVAAQVQGFFRHEERVLRLPARAVAEKRGIVESMLGRSSRECERRLVELAPDRVVPREKERAVAGNRTLIQFTADAALYEKLDRLKGLLAHRNFEGEYAKLFDQLADIALKTLDPAEKKKETASAQTQSSRPSELKIVSPAKNPPKPKYLLPTSEVSISSSVSEPSPKSSFSATNRPSRYIRASIKREIWRRDGGRCTFRNRNHRCNSRHALEYDHIHPHAWGGPSSLENLTLRCAAHNQHRARKMGFHRPTIRSASRTIIRSGSV